MADASSPAFAASPASRQLWASLSPAQRSVVQSLRALGAGAPVSKWHRLGRLALRLSSDHKAIYGHNTLDALADLVDSTSQVVGKARKFARLYAAAEATDLDGKVTWEQMQRIVAIGDVRTRRNLLNGCRSKNWSVRQLEREIRRQVGRQRPFGRGGRLSRRPESLQEALADIARLMTAIIRWYRALEPEVAADSERSSRRSASGRLFDSDQIPQQLRGRITDAIERLERVREAVQGAMEAGVGQRPNRTVKRRR
jgi:hypothetical protein